MADKTEALVLQLSSSYQDRCRLYLNECLEELSQRFELFQRQTLDDLLRGCLALSNQALDPQAAAAEHEVDTDCLRRLPASSGPALVLQPKRERCVSIYSPEGSAASTPVGCSCGCGQEAEAGASDPSPREDGPSPRPQPDVRPSARPRARFPRVRPKRLAPRPARLDHEMRSALVSIISSRPDISISRLNAELRVLLPRKSPVSDDVVRRAARGVFFTLPEMEEEAEEEAGEEEARGFALWLRERLRDPAGPRVVFVAEWRFSVFLRRRVPPASLLLALSGARGLESHRVTRTPASGPLLAAFVQAVAAQSGPCVLVLAPQLRRHAARLAEAARCAVKLLPARAGCMTPLQEALQAWRAEMQLKLEAESARSLLQDMQSAPAHSAEAAADLLFQVLREHAEAALSVLQPETALSWMQRSLGVTAAGQA